MAIKEFTSEQRSAIDSKCPILVSAAAGSGKTAVLTERVIKMLIDENNQTPADKLLIVTFTNAAADEMRSRIENRLYEESLNQPNNAWIIRQRRMLASADICTIDSFCINLVRENFEKCEVEPNFKVGDGTDMKLICREILTDIINRKMIEDSDNLNGLFELFSCEYDDTELKDFVDDLYQYSQQIPFPDKFLDNLISAYSKNFDNSHPWALEIKNTATEYTDSMNECLSSMLDNALYFTYNREKCDNYTKNLIAKLNELTEKLNSFSFDEFREVLYSISVDTITVGSKNGLCGEIFKERRKEFADILSKLQALFSETTEQINAENQKILPKLNLLVDIVKEYGKLCFEAYKQENKLNFSQTEQLALNILCECNENGEISVADDAKSYLSRYNEVMVDEFQDVNDLQNMLFFILSDFGKKLFVVGDIKQSIYRFRGSNLLNFLSKKQTYIPIENANEDEPKKIILSDNFRSRKGICDFTNFLFSKILTEKTGEIVYNGEEELHPAAMYPKSDEVETELMLVLDDDENEESLYIKESTAIANYINEIIDREFKVSDDGKTSRNANYGDICILLDKVSNKAPVLAKILTENGIPVSYSNQKFCETVEISLVLSLLTVLENPARDVELLCVLMSPLFGFSAEELATFRADSKSGNIYSALLLSAINGNEKSKSFLDEIKKYRYDMAVLPLSKLIDKLINDTGLFAIVSAMDKGNIRRNNLLHLQSLAKEFDYFSATEFVKYVNEMPQGNVKSEGADKNCVSIMSMHKSKGLQFPICILSDLSSKINKDDSISKIVYKNELGIGFRYFDENDKVYNENLARKVISKKILAENIEEKMRLLYVAMTRAKEKLVLVTSLGNAEKTFERLSFKLEFGEISPRFVKSVNCFADLVLAGCLIHPSCDELRNLYDLHLQKAVTDSKIKVITVNTYNKSQKETKEEEFEINGDLAKKIEQNISFVYPFEELSKIEAKTSVSAVAKSAETREYLFSDRPSFMNAGGMTSAGKGTAMHSIMQYINFSENVDVNAEVERLAEWQYITEQQCENADREKLNQFFSSELYKRILKAVDVKREMRFLTELPAGKIDGNISDGFKNAPVLIQGAVDLIFDEGDGLVVVDFKTDRVKEAEQLVSLYSEQLDIYSKASERIFNKKVKEKIIYSFELGSTICL